VGGRRGMPIANPSRFGVAAQQRMSFGAVKPSLRRLLGRFVAVTRRHCAGEYPMDRLFRARNAVELCIGAKGRCRQLLIDRAQAIVGLKIVVVQAPKRFEGLLGAGKGLDLKLRVANNSQSCATPLEAADLLGEQAQVAGSTCLLRDPDL